MICHECGSDVAQNDVYCPYCGITLEHAATLAEATDESMANTIMIPNIAPAPVKDASKSGGPGSDRPQEQKPGQPAQDLAETLYNVEEIPPPSILADTGKTRDNFEASSTSEYYLKVGKKNTESKPDARESPGAFSQPDSEIPAADNRKEAGRESQSQVNEAENILDLGGPNRIESGPESISNPESALFVERPAHEQGILKPADDLETSDPFLSSATFDSVRIIENQPTSRPDDVETRIKPMTPDTKTSERAIVSEIERKPPVSGNKEESPTTPNIALGETDGKRGSKLKPLAEGTILNGRYEIVRKIGGGGMGAVYLASDNNLGGVLRAVKEMVQAHIEEEQQEKAINDFKRESMILSSLDHVSIPTIYDYFYDEKESRFYLVMKYISGGDLSSRVRSAAEGRIDEKSVTDWAIQITDVLDYLHNQPSTIVYRDLKPSNIMLDGNSGRVMLIDFGIARSIHQKEEKGVTAVGTMGYAPPELFSGNVEPRSDIYSLGSTMFHLLTGADPQSNPLLIFDFQKNPRPRQINSQLSDQIERILMRAVEYSAESRFKSAAEMRDVLENHRGKLKTGNVTHGVTEIPASVSLSNQSVFCGFCGQRIVATDLFCAFCGAKQPLAQQGVHSEIYAHGAMTAKLVIEGTSELAAPVFSLQKDENLLGRRDPMSNIFPEVDLSKYDPQTKISRRHARIWREGSNFMVEDLGSSNGTILARSLNDSFRLVPKQPHVLTAGDKIKVGDATLHFVIG